MAQVKQAASQESEQEELERLSERFETLRRDLADAKSVHAQLSGRLAQAIVKWEAVDSARDVGHSPREIEQMAALRAAAQEATARVADLTQKLQAVESEIPARKAREAVARSSARAIEVWTPACQALIEPAQALLTALQTQRAAWNTLYWEQATGTIEQDTILGGGGNAFSDPWIEELTRFLAVAEREDWAIPEKRGIFKR